MVKGGSVEKEGNTRGEEEQRPSKMEDQTLPSFPTLPDPIERRPQGTLSTKHVRDNSRFTHRKKSIIRTSPLDLKSNEDTRSSSSSSSSSSRLHPLGSVSDSDPPLISSHFHLPADDDRGSPEGPIVLPPISQLDQPHRSWDRPSHPL